MLIPTEPKIYHIVHVDRLASILAEGNLWSDTVMTGREGVGTTIGMDHIKQRRRRLPLPSYPDVNVGDCVPFYFCPRSVMLYKLHARGADLEYQGGQEPIVHLEADLRRTVDWAEGNGQRWVFTSGSAAALAFDDFTDLARLDKLDWDAIGATWWSGPNAAEHARDRKQAEYLIERSFPWELVERVGVASQAIGARVWRTFEGSHHRPPVKVKRDWYY